MRLTNFSYSRIVPQNDVLKFDDIDFGNINLIVGLNATGKTRLLNVIAGFAGILCGRRDVGLGSFFAKFEQEDSIVTYQLETEKDFIVKEIFCLNGVERLNRGPDGKGTIFAKELDDYIRFGLGKKQLAFSTKRDTVQHEFLEGLAIWAEEVRHYRFTENMGHKSLFHKQQDEKESKIDTTDPEKVVAIFLDGERKSKDFKKGIINDFKRIGYSVEDIEAGELEFRGVVSHQPLPKPLYGLRVKEKDLEYYTEHMDMSQGMFRALSLLCNLNYACMFGPQKCLLLDDIGEGLDFDRSKKLIEIIVEKAMENKFQLIMTTNDRFVMNSVPLRYWEVMLRKGTDFKILNYRNSKNIFDEFELAGLNNFDFFSGRFWEEKKEGEEVEDA